MSFAQIATFALALALGSWLGLFLLPKLNPLLSRVAAALVHPFKQYVLKRRARAAFRKEIKRVLQGAVLLVLFCTPASAQFTTHGMTIPAGYPRLFWNATRITACTTYLAAHPFTPATDIDIAYQAVCGSASCATPVADAIAFLVPYTQWNSGAAGSDQYRQNGANQILIFDWCESSFSTSSPSGTTTLSTSITAGQDISMVVGSSTSAKVGDVVNLGGAGAEDVIIESVPDMTHIQVQNVLNSHTNGITITYDSDQQSWVKKWTIWAQGIQAQTWGGSQNGGMYQNNYYWGDMRNEFMIGVVTDGLNGSGGGSAPDNLIDDSLVTRWTNQVVANAVANGTLAGGAADSGGEYGAAQWQYWHIVMLSAKNMGRDLSSETPYFKGLLYDTLYFTTPSTTYDISTATSQFMFTSWGHDENYAIGGILGTRAYIEDGMDVFAQLYSGINAGKYARQWLNQFPIVAPGATDPYNHSGIAYYVSNHIFAADPGGTASAYTSLPLDNYNTGFEVGIMKSAWDSTSTWLFYEFGNKVPGGADIIGSGRNEYGTFDIWRGGRWLTRQTISYANTLGGEPNICSNGNVGDGTGDSLYNNSVEFTNVALGQDSNACYVRPTIQNAAPTIKRLETQAGYGYVVFDTTSSYLWDSGHPTLNTGVVSSMVRELLYIRSLETVIVFDREVTANQTHDGSTTAANVITTAAHHYEVSPTQDGGASDYIHWTETNGTQVLRQTILLPTGLSASNPRLINEASCGGCSAVGQYRLAVDNSGAATRYHLSCLQARDTSGSNLTCSVVDSTPADPTMGTFTITLHPSVGSDTTVVFNKGATSSGGTINVGNTCSLNLSTTVQAITYTDSGPAWSGSQACGSGSDDGPVITF